MDLAKLKLPLDDYIETPESRWAVDRAINIIGRECMRRLGLDWPVVKADYASPKPHLRRYGIIDAQYGYHPPPPPAEVRPPDQWASLSPEQATAWTGQQPTAGRAHVAPGGCAAEAMRTLLAGAPSPPAIQTQQLANEALAQATKDSRVQAAFGNWSECMRRAGLNYRTPWDINDDPQWHRAPQPGAAEIAAARTDVACRQATNLVGIWFAVERSYQRRVVEQYASELAILSQVIKTQNEAAARAIAAEPS